jgi:methionyl aminopeptidase
MDSAREHKFEKMRAVGMLTTQCLDELAELLKPGWTTDKVNMFVLQYEKYHGLHNSQYNYLNENDMPFPAYCCTSVNEVMCHGIPGLRVLKDGDLLKVDVTFSLDGYHGDACRTFIVGRPTAEGRDLVQIAESALKIGMQQVEPGNHFGLIGKSIQEYCDHNKVSIPADFVGHGIGLVFHDYPQVSHTYDPDMPSYNLEMREGDTFTIEPIICQKKADWKLQRDGWTVATRDKGLSAQFEATLGVTKDGYEIFAH